MIPLSIQTKTTLALRDSDMMWRRIATQKNYAKSFILA
jgi:hypothetical protein